MVILSTKELNKKQVALLDQKKFALIHANFIKIKWLKFVANKSNECLIFTSKNAVKGVLKSNDIKTIKEKDCFCVGEKTKMFLEKNGFTVVTHQKDANTLAETICKEYFQKTFTFFSGTLRKDILPKKLAAKKIHLDEISVYKTLSQSKKIILETVAILFFSPSAVASYLETNTLTNQVCFCIGHTTAQAIGEYTNSQKTNQIVIASEPTIESVIEEVIKYYNV
ncbi:uroporphyrinogen-III synthase [Flavobacterium sp. J27]|uniref:uroporphyrinogen-III synthase n=1 Tax=Flavobacterium sp. J27 TaxID=2060419 RepID=UPI00102FD538|nr:uroporphyrinogen-III synthase [Flavobacterium sp. J27]